jgi:hypothetical protein
MAITLGDAVLWLRTNNDKLESGLLSAERSAKGVITKMGGAFALGVGAAIGSAGVALAGFAKGAIEGNAQFETYLTQFGVLLKDTDLAKQRLTELAEFGAKTPFELPEVVEADKILQGFGLHAEDVAAKFGKSGEEIRRIAGDVASGAGVSFQDMATYIGKFASGSTGEVISRFQELGIMTRQQMADWGLEFSKSGELLTPVEEAMDVVLARMDEKYGGMMDQQSSTLEGMKSNLTDFFDNAVRIAGKPIFDKFKQTFETVLEVLSSESMTNAINSLAEFIAAVLSGDGEATDHLLDFFTNLGGALGLSQEQMQPFLETFQEVSDFLSTQVAPVIESIKATVLDFVTNAIIPFVTEHAEEIKGALLAIGAVFAAAGIISGIMAVAGLIASLASPIGLIVGLAALLGAAWAGNWGGIREKTQAVIDWLKPFLSGAWEFIKLVWDTGVQNVKQIFELFQLAFTGDWRGFGEKLREIWDKQIERIKEIGKKLKEWFTNTDWGEVGRNILHGIANGITAALQFIRDAATNAAKAALEAAKGFLGIASPSKRARREVGEPTGEGFGLGIIDKVKSMGKGFGEIVLDSFGGIRPGSLSLPAPVYVSLEYKPFISTADRYEAESLLEPIVQNINRKG